MSLLDLQGMPKPTRGGGGGGGHEEDSNLSVGCDGDSGLSLLCD